LILAVNGAAVIELVRRASPQGVSASVTIVLELPGPVSLEDRFGPASGAGATERRKPEHKTESIEVYLYDFIFAPR
jgi:hypothetical protein